MSSDSFFVDRRRGNDRRLDADPCKDLPVDLFHRKRRKSSDRRAPERSLMDDYYAFVSAPEAPSAVKFASPEKKKPMQ